MVLVRGQGALEYLLLIAGAVLVSVVILVLIFATTSTSGGFINQGLNTYANLSGGSGGGGVGTCGDGICDAGEPLTCAQDCTGLPIVSIATTDAIANEDDLLNDPGKVTITRTGSTAAALDVFIDADFGAAINGADFQLIPGQVTIPSGAASVDVDIIPTQDSLVEGVEDAVATVLDSGAAATYVLSTIPGEIDAIVDIIDDDSAAAETVMLTVVDADADEEIVSDIGQFTIARIGSTPAQLALPLDVSIAMSGAATNGTDYQSVSNPITIPANATTVNVDIVTINDGLSDDDETVNLTIQSSTLYIISGSRNGTVTIHDSDGGVVLPVVTLTVSDSTASEPGTNTGTFTVTRSIVDTSVLTVNVALSGTATNGTDYAAAPIPVVISANQASATLTVTPQDDTSVEGSETVVATIASAPLSYVVGNPSFGSINLLDDDNPPVSMDVCTNYNEGAVNKPGSFPSYSSIFQQSWTWRRALNPATDIDIGTGLDSTSLISSYNSAACGSTIAVHNLTGSELNGLKFNGKNCPTNSPIHVYFVSPVVITGAGDVIGIDNVHGLVIDGMNNLTVKATLGSSPRALFFIGHHTTGAPGTTAATRIVIKNLEADGTYDPAVATKTKWAFFGENNTDLGFCNLDIHDIWWEHGFYFHTMAGNFEVVESKIDNVGRTCVQLRNDWAGTPNTNYIIANNDCSRQRNGGAITADDSSGTWWIHGNRIVKAVQGFVSIDSQQQGYFDHRDGEVFLYDNKIKMGEQPIAYPNWQPGGVIWGGGGTSAIASLFNIRDGGTKFYVRNNTFVNVPGATLNVLQKQYVDTTGGHYPNELTESNNNTFGMGHSSYNGNTGDRLTRWDTSGGSCFISVAQWTSTSNQCGKPPQPYDAQSTFVWKNFPANNPAFTALLNLFSGMP